MKDVFTLSLSDGITWGIVSGNAAALPIVSRFAESMQLGLCGKPIQQLLVSVEKNLPYRARMPFVDNGTIACSVNPPLDADLLAMQMMRVAAVICLDIERRGGLLVHGALVERDGYGVILAGPGGVGKTTATQRLPHPWRSLSDDATLIVRDKRGEYWAHPWPTWSRFLLGRPGGTWNVQDSVPLKGIFLLSQAQENRVTPVHFAQAVCSLVELIEQVSHLMSRGMDEDEERNLRLNRFDNICALVRAMPCYILHLNLTGPFWQEIEQVIIGSGKGGS